MKKEDFQKQHGFDDQQMAKIDHFRATFGCKTPCVFINQDEGRWVQEVIEKRKENGRN